MDSTKSLPLLITIIIYLTLNNFQHIGLFIVGSFVISVVLHNYPKSWISTPDQAFHREMKILEVTICLNLEAESCLCSIRRCMSCKQPTCMTLISVGYLHMREGISKQ